MTRCCLPLIGMMLAISANSAFGQDKGSHVRIPDWDAGSNPANAEAMSRQLRARFGTSLPPSIDPELMAQLKQFLNSTNLENAKKALENNPDLKKSLNNFARDNPDWKNQLRQKLASAPGGRSPSQIDDLLKNLPVQPRNPDDGPPDLSPRVRDAHQPEQPSTQPHDRFPSKFNGNRPPWADDDRFAATDGSDKSERFREFVKRMSGYLPKSMANSDAVKRLTKGFNRIDWGKTSKWNFLPENFGSKLKLGDRLQGTGRFLKRAFDSLEGRQMPDLPDIRAPKISGGSSLPGFIVPDPSSGGGSEGVLTAILVFGVVIVAAYLARRLLMQPRNARQSAAGGWDVGSWPIHPKQIRTGKELIEAFDHLALRTSGKPARHWHHHAVAKQMGAEDQLRQATAQRLAGVYEQARYAPPNEPLVETQIDIARKDICTLAGVDEP